MEISQTIKDIAEAIQAEGGRGYLVGGFVRDHILGRTIKDIDLEVFGVEPHALKKLCRRFGRVITVGAAFAVLKLLTDDGDEIDLSLPRRERQVGSGHTGFEVEADPGMSMEEAAQRRDLTINAISMDPLTGEIIDPCDGRTDLADGVLRHVGPRFREDPLRVLRLIQFAGRFGFRIAPETQGLCREMVVEGLLETLSQERVEEEIRKLMVRGIPEHIPMALEQAYQMGIITVLMPDLARLRDVPQDPRYHAEGDGLTHTILTVRYAAEIAVREALEEDDRYILCLAALVHDLGKAETTVEQADGTIISHGHEAAGRRPAAITLEKCVGAHRIREYVLALSGVHMRPLQLAMAKKVTDGAIRRLARTVAPSNLIMLSHLVEADTLASKRGPGVDPPVNAHFFLRERAGDLGVSDSPPVPLITGRHLIRLAHAGEIPSRFKQGGPHFGKILQHVFDAQLDGEISDEEAGLVLLKRLVTQQEI